MRPQRDARRVLTASVPWLVLGAVLIAAGPVRAGGNDLVLRRLGECAPSRADCQEVVADEAGFDALTRDLGLAFSPKGLAPAETLGLAGFEFAFEMVFNIADRNTDYWEAAAVDDNPNNLLMVSQFHIRKGLPFSFEIGGILSHLFDSSMWALGAELSWALHEDTLWPVPDFGVRGFVNNVVGNSDLNLTTAGFDAVLSLPVGIANTYSLTPYAGYNFTAVFSSSRLLDATPEDPTPPVEGTATTSPNKPEFVFDNRHNTFNRFVGGLRFKFAMLNATFETAIGADVQSISLHVGLDF